MEMTIKMDYLGDPLSDLDVGGLVLTGSASGTHPVGRGSPRGSLARFMCPKKADLQAHWAHACSLGGPWGLVSSGATPTRAGGPWGASRGSRDPQLYNITIHLG